MSCHVKAGSSAREAAPGRRADKADQTRPRSAYYGLRNRGTDQGRCSLRRPNIDNERVSDVSLCVSPCRQPHTQTMHDARCKTQTARAPHQDPAKDCTGCATATTRFLEVPHEVPHQGGTSAHKPPRCTKIYSSISIFHLSSIPPPML